MKVIEFLKNAKVFYSATVDRDQPHVRPLGFVMEYNGELAFYSDKRKNIYKQLQVNPKMEICAIDEKMNTLRIECSAKFITTEDSQKAAIESFPMLSKMGYSVGDGVFEIYTIENPKLSYTALTGEKLDGIEL